MSKTATVTYFEKRSVNIGDYENVEFCLTLQGVEVKPPMIGRGNKKVEISATEKETVDQAVIMDEEQIEAVFTTVIRKVQSRLNAVEKKVRMQVADWQGMSFDTEAKAVKRKLVKQEDYSGKYGSRMEIDEDEP